MNLTDKEKKELESVFSAIHIKKQSFVKKYYKNMSKKILTFFKKHPQAIHKSTI